MPLYLDHVPLTGPGLYYCTKFYPMMVVFTSAGVLSYHIAAILSNFKLL